MRNVTIWELNDVVADVPPFVRMYTYKGYKGTLNEFLYPNFVHREDHIVPRDRNAPGNAIPCKLFQKGMTVIVGYSSLDCIEKGDGIPMLVFNTFEQAVNWMVRNNYDYYGEESSHARRRKVKAVDFFTERRKYIEIARDYETMVRSREVPVPPAPPVPPKTRVVKDDDSLSRQLRHDSSIPVPESKKPIEHKSFFRRLMDFLTK
ncbi:hypothetical protein PWKp5_00183 [Klebsiella phage PWKp5]|nr:hypothetical protein PWKp5_00183 [Klebsiella phage PWKp5]